MRSLRNKRVLITGGARGIGLALAQRFVTEGAEVVLTDISRDALVEAREKLGQLGQLGQATRTYPLDVTDAEAASAVRAALHRDAGPIDVLVNNAGIVHGGAFLDVPLASHEQTYRVNVFGVVNVTHVFLPDLISRPESHLVNVASASGFIGLPLGTTYASSKWAVIGLSESLRLEMQALGHGHVRVTTICPSYVRTGLFDGARPPRTTRLLTPERLAGQVLRAMRRNRPFLLTPWLVKLTPPMKGLLPTGLFDRISSLLGATSGMAHWRGRNGRGEA